MPGMTVPGSDSPRIRLSWNQSCPGQTLLGTRGAALVQDQLLVGSTLHMALETTAGDRQGEEGGIWVKLREDKWLQPGRNKVNRGWEERNQSERSGK